ncbi:MAG TPA: Chromate resistance protein ChrB, partial [Longimicrobiaceae bacterium]|nr:Chromate resistance protein ChrB [Longimicrobiaceae bacterium]
MEATPWLFLIHQIPPQPPYLRVKVWRRLQRLGAVAVKNSVYVLPAGAQAREDFAWLRGEIESEGGDAVVCEVRLLDGLSNA